MSTIPRISLPSRDAFLEQWVFPQRPVVITNLFEGEAIRGIDSVASAKAQLGDVPLIYRSSTDEDFTRFVTTFLASAERTGEMPTLANRSTLGAFLDLLVADPDSRMVCPEVPSTMLEKIGEMYRVPDFCAPIEGTRPDHNWSMWLGNSGYTTQLHYDGDYRSIVQYQLFGEKRVILIPSRSSAKLAPVSNESLVTPDGLEGEALETFLKFHGGYETTVRTGEAIFIPSGFWHYFHYRQITLALSLRFALNDRLRFMALNLHNDRFLQALAARLLDPRNVTPEAVAAYDAIHLEFETPCADPVAKAERITELARAAFYGHAKGADRAPHLRPALEAFERAVRAQIVREGQLYVSGTTSTLAREAGIEHGLKL